MQNVFSGSNVIDPVGMNYKERERVSFHFDAFRCMEPLSSFYREITIVFSLFVGLLNHAAKDWIILCKKRVYKPHIHSKGIYYTLSL